MAPPKLPQLPRHAEDVDPSEKDAMHLEGVKYFLEHPPEDTQASEVLGVTSFMFHITVRPHWIELQVVICAS